MSDLEPRGTRRKRNMPAIWALVLLLSLVLPASTGLATPTPDYIIVNHATKECTQSILGDDCTWCDPPPGWEVLGTVSFNQCPDGYTRVQRIDMQCQAYKNEFCCSGGSHHGDCEDLVLNDADRLCAFVEDIQGCALPEGWLARPSAEVYWACPHDYRWIESLDCLAPSPLDLPGTVDAPPTPSEPGISVSVPIATVLVVLCLGAVFVTIAVACLLLVVVVVRRSRS